MDRRHGRMGVVGRRIAAGGLLVVSGGLVAVPAANAAASRPFSSELRQHSLGVAAVTITTPKGVPANVALVGHGRQLAIKRVRGARHTSTLSLPSGRYHVRPLPTVFNGQLYEGHASRRSIVIRAGSEGRLSVHFVVVRAASKLHATAISQTAISLAWNAPVRGSVVLRRTLGTTAAGDPRQGAAVTVHGHAARDDHLKAGAHYTYALFTRNRHHWLGPITVLAGTKAPVHAKTASFVTSPGAILATNTTFSDIAETSSGVSVVLLPSAETPVIGTAVVLPMSTTLPGGFVGTVTSISADGRTLMLAATGLSAAFSYYNISVPSFDSGPAALIPASATGTKDRGAPSAAAESDSCLGGNIAQQITLRPSLDLTGSFNAKIDTFNVLGAHVPRGADIDMQLAASITAAADVDTSGDLECDLPFKRIDHVLTTDPVPISFVFNPTAGVNVTGDVDIQNLGVRAEAGVALSGHFGLGSGASFSGHPILSASLLTPKVTASGTVGVELGGQVIVGPGAGTADAGVVAGVSGELDPLEASFGPVFSTGDPRYNACLRAEAKAKLGFGLTASAWLGSWSINREITIPALNFEKDLHAPWYYPSDCENAAGPPRVDQASLPDARVSALYDETLSASGGYAPYTWQVTSGALPPGLALSTDGEITGRPIAAGVFGFTAQVTDNDNTTATADLSITVKDSTTTGASVDEYDVSDDLGCAMYDDADGSGEFFGNTACGTFVGINGDIYGPGDIPYGGSLDNNDTYEPWDPTVQTTSGSGTRDDPYVTTTSAVADDDPLSIAQTDSYVPGGSTVTTSSTISNTSSSAVSITIYHAFDCYPGDSDTGTGTSNPGAGSVSCVSDNIAADGERTLQLTPARGGSHYVEEYYDDLWTDISNQATFDDTVRADDHDTSEGLCWNVTIPANSSVTVGYRTSLLNSS